MGVSIREKKRTATLTQPQLIDEILRDVRIGENVKPVLIPAMPTKILYRFLKDPPHNDRLFHFQLVVGKLSYLKKTSRPNIAYAVHQCARFASNPRRLHTHAVMYLGK